MSNMIPFSFENHSVRAFNINGTPWVVGKDLCNILGYANHNDAMNRHCRGVVKRYPIVDSLGRNQEVRIINEPDTYRLITGSTLPDAERFETWVFEEVLPAIRQTGSYSLPSNPANTTLTVQMAQLCQSLDALRSEIKNINRPTTPTTAKKPISSRPYVQPIADYLAQRNGATVTVSEIKAALNLPIHNTAIGRILSGLGRTVHIANVNNHTTRLWN